MTPPPAAELSDLEVLERLAVGDGASSEGEWMAAAVVLAAAEAIDDCLDAEADVREELVELFAGDASLRARALAAAEVGGLLTQQVGGLLAQLAHVADELRARWPGAVASAHHTAARARALCERQQLVFDEQDHGGPAGSPSS